ncbi:DUF192 domain-containing protein [Asticcacaulis solisilvae]|uniref:DUF192 domain-containing protein n=1 Tax=Asticcacaulis solisilvae TaxID=1217274 RepID=UPI003FD80106
MKISGKRGLIIAGVAAIAIAGGAAFAMQANLSPSASDMPADCLSMNLKPYSVRQPLDIKGDAKTLHFKVEIARTASQREQGLMCRTGLSDDYGMLFEFGDSAERTFWMENTLSALDIIYIAPDGRIVSIQKYAKPLDRTPLPSYGDASGVLEINAGLSDKLGLAPGDMVDHPFFHKP